MDFAELGNRCQSIKLPEESRNDVNLLVTAWYDGIKEHLDDLAPIKTFPTRKYKSPWLTIHIKQLIQYRDWLVKKLRQNKDPRCELVNENFS